MAARLGQAAAEADGHGAVQFQLRDVAVVLLPLGHGHARHLDFAAAEFPGPAQGADAHEDHALVAGSPHHDFAQRRHQRERHQRHGTQQKGNTKQGLEQIKFVVRNLRAVKATHGTAGPDQREGDEDQGGERTGGGADFKFIGLATQPSAARRAGKIHAGGFIAVELQFGEAIGRSAAAAQGDVGGDVDVGQRNLGAALGTGDWHGQRPVN